MAFFLDNSGGGKKKPQSKQTLRRAHFEDFSRCLFLPNHLIAFSLLQRQGGTTNQLILIS